MKRTIIKWLHWLCTGLILYFFLVEPEDSQIDPGGALSTHAGVGLLLAIIVLIWFSVYLAKGLASRPGPKLPPWAKRAHPLMHKALYIGLPVMLLTGGLTGLLAPYIIKGFGFIPLTLTTGSEDIHDILEEVHEFTFDVLIVLVVAHMLFHIWRHIRLKDNALRIMAPKILHKYL